MLPGLTDVHVHFPPPSLPGQTELFALLHLLHGVTTVRDAGDVDGMSSAPAVDGVEAGRFPGPRVFACGPFVDGDPPRWGNSLVATTPDEGRTAVRTIAEGGFDCVKAYNELDSPTLAAIREEASTRGLPVIGHVPRDVPYEEALLGDAQHLMGVAPPLDDQTVVFPQILRAWHELEDARLDRVIAVALENGLAHTPTLITNDRLVAQEDPAAVRREADAQLLARFYRDVIWSTEEGISAARLMEPRDFEMVRGASAIQRRAVKRMYDAGVELHTGTDAMIAFVVPGAGLHRELRLLESAGLTPEQVLELSSRTSARYLDESLGELRAGAPAELAIFRDDPTRDLAALDTLVAVVRSGRLYTREDLEKRLARYREHHESALYDALVIPIVRAVLARSVPDRN
ncbi:MAG: amidohydrolase family protein [Myxococcales bacterium]|nr:amidohydrolase family protein [Myxococcales bacterium]